MAASVRSLIDYGQLPSICMIHIAQQLSLTAEGGQKSVILYDIRHCPGRIWSEIRDLTRFR